jgi:hypothetical protein
MKTWEELKNSGSEHYKGLSQPIDVYRSKGVFKPFALCSISKYATRNMDKELNPQDMIKIIHYAELILAEYNESKQAGGAE